MPGLIHSVKLCYNYFEFRLAIEKLLAFYSFHVSSSVSGLAYAVATRIYFLVREARTTCWTRKLVRVATALFDTLLTWFDKYFCLDRYFKRHATMMIVMV